MAYQNLSGTTKKSFKIGPGGVILTSTATKDGDKIRKYLMVNQTNDEGHNLRVAFESENEPIYDTFIKSSDIGSISYTNNKVIFKLRNNTEIVLDLLLTSVDAVGAPETSTEDAIAIFEAPVTDEAGNTKHRLKDSGLKIERSDITNDPENTVPSSQAVVNYVGGVSEPLRQRLGGTSKNS